MTRLCGRQDLGKMVRCRLQILGMIFEGEKAVYTGRLTDLAELTFIRADLILGRKEVFILVMRLRRCRGSKWQKKVIILWRNEL